MNLKVKHSQTQYLIMFRLVAYCSGNLIKASQPKDMQTTKNHAQQIFQCECQALEKSDNEGKSCGLELQSLINSRNLLIISELSFFKSFFISKLNPTHETKNLLSVFLST